MTDRQKERLMIGVIIGSGLLVRLYRIDQPLLEFFPQRQTQTAEITRNTYVNGWQDFWIPKVRYISNQPVPFVFEFPLYNGIVAVLYRLFGPNVIWGRIVSLIFFLGSSLILYQLVKSSIIHHSSSMYALLFFVFSPLHILVSRSFQPDELALFLLLLSIYRASWLVFGLAVLVKFPLFLFFPILMLRARRRGTSLVRSVAHFLIFSLPSAWWYWRASRLALTVQAMESYRVVNWFQPPLMLNPHWYWSLFQIETVWVFTVIGFFIFVIGVWTTRTNSLWKYWALSGLLYLFVFNYHAMTHEYYHVYLVPIAAGYVGIGLRRLYTLFASLPTWQRVSGQVVITILFIFGLFSPAWRRISAAPLRPGDSTEVSVHRYRLIEQFDNDTSVAP